MLLIENHRTEPYFNIALEEYLFRNFQEDCFMLWRNEDAIVVGKHQNALAEINADFAAGNGIKVVRRLSGGGTVFHDLGNINFTFILTRETEKVVDFRLYMKPIYELLIREGVEVYYSDRNDLFIDGKKVSGNAEHAVRNRVLHHGTLLYSSEIGRLSEALKVTPSVYKDNAVKSVRSPVTNILPYLEKKLDIAAFMHLVKQHTQTYYDNCTPYQLSDHDVEQVNRLAEEKYVTWEWNYGYSPKYEYHNAVMLNGQLLEMSISVKKGMIEQVTLTTGLLQKQEEGSIVEALTGMPHMDHLIQERIVKIVGEGLITSATAEALMKILTGKDIILNTNT